MKIKKITIGEFSDSHVGHNKTTTGHILSSLSRLFPDNSVTAEYDLIIIAGDFFDRDLALHNEETVAIKEWIIRFLRICKKHDIVLRVLEGTPSHDWKQSALFTFLNDTVDIGADVKYFDKLDIEYIERFGINVLYIPDEWKPTTEEVWSDVIAKLNEKQLTQVDFAVMHGMFPHQMAKHLHNRLRMHNPTDYLKIVKYIIFIGHIHLTSVYERILSAGSTDRIAHGEEGKKGMFKVVVRDNGDFNFKFIENTNAKKYITVNCTDLSVEESESKINTAIKTLPEDSYVRIKARSSDQVLLVLNKYFVNYPRLHWDFYKVDERKDDKPVEFLVDQVALTKDSIFSLLLKRVQETEPSLIEHASKMLEGVLNA